MKDQSRMRTHDFPLETEMASVVTANSLGNLNDITKDLPSLLFENALSEDEKGPYLILRKRSHAITVSACAQATYFVAVLNEAR